MREEAVKQKGCYIEICGYVFVCAYYAPLINFLTL